MIGWSHKSFWLSKWSIPQKFDYGQSHKRSFADAVLKRGGTPILFTLLGLTGKNWSAASIDLRPLQVHTTTIDQNWSAASIDSSYFSCSEFQINQQDKLQQHQHQQWDWGFWSIDAHYTIPVNIDWSTILSPETSVYIIITVTRLDKELSQITIDRINTSVQRKATTQCDDAMRQRKAATQSGNAKQQRKAAKHAR